MRDSENSQDDEATRDVVRTALGPSSDAPIVAERVLAGLREGSRHQLQSRRRTRSRRMLAWAVVGLIFVVVAGNFVAARVSPSYATALAKAPLVGGFAGPLLRAAGLTTEQLTPASSKATSHGHTLAVVGGFADTTRTVVVIQVDGKNTPLGKTVAGYVAASGMYHGHLTDPTLRDQYGHSYDIAGGVGQDLFFGPLVGRAADGPVRLTLLVPTINFNAAHRAGTPAKGESVNGDWIVRLTLTQHPAVTIPSPAPVKVGDITYTIKSIQVSGTFVSVYWRASGGTEIASLYQQTRQPGGPDVAPGSPFMTLSNSLFSASIENKSGSMARTYGFSGGITFASPTLIIGKLQDPLAKPGSYLIAIGVPALVSFPITVP
jgi:hypothetical protein